MFDFFMPGAIFERVMGNEKIKNMPVIHFKQLCRTVDRGEN